MNLVEDNLGLVHSCARRFMDRGIEYEELYSIGCVGLLKAAKRFDESRGLCFSTYAVPVILGEIKGLFRDGGMIKVSRSIKELSLKISRISVEYSAENGRAPAVSELALMLSVSKEQVTEAMNSSLPAVSLTGDDGECEYDLPVESGCEGIDNRISLGQALKKLSKNDRKLIILRYFGSKTQQQTAKILGISQVQVSRQEKKILNALKMELSG